MERIDWVNGKVPINRTNLNGMQDNIEKTCVVVSATEPTSNESVWIKTGKNLYNPKNAYITGTLSQNIGLVYSNIKVGQTYTFSANNYSWVSIKAYNSSNQIIRELGNTETTKNVTITIQDTEVYIELMFFSGVNNLNSINNVDFTKVQLEQNLTATDYEEYIDKEIYVKNENGVFERFYSENELSQQNYSASEQKIGTWMNGKTLYRIAREINVNAGNEAVLTMPSGCSIKKCNAWLNKTDTPYENLLNWNSSSADTNDFGVLYYARPLNQIILDTSIAGVLTIIVEYTKD